MAVVPNRRLALLGGGFSIDDDGLLDDWVLDQAPTLGPGCASFPPPAATLPPTSNNSCGVPGASAVSLPSCVLSAGAR